MSPSEHAAKVERGEQMAAGADQESSRISLLNEERGSKSGMMINARFHFLVMRVESCFLPAERVLGP